jgi:hypothetical protein
MAIPNQSNINNLVSRGIQSVGSSDAIATFSGGTMPEVIRNNIVNVISEYLGDLDPNIPNNIPGEVYSIVAEIMSPYTQGLTAESLIPILRSNSVFGNLPVGNFDVGSIIDDNLGMFINQYEQQLLRMTGGFDALLGKFGVGDKLASIVTEISGGARALIGNFLSSVLSPQELGLVSFDVVSTLLTGSGVINVLTDLPQISTDPLVESLLQTTQDAEGNIDLDSLSDEQRDTLAAGYIKGASGTDVEVSTLKLKAGKIRATAAGTVEQTEELPSPNPYTIDADRIDPEGSFISSVEELEAEMASVTRDVSEVIVHWSETYTNANLSAAQLTELTGAGGDTYHLIIRRDGSVERGLPLNMVGDHCSLLGHNEHAIAVCFVGGLNVSSGTTELYEVAAARSITLSQYNSFYHIMRTFFVQFPGGQALGHMDIDIGQEDPGFDVRDYVFNNFNKQSLYINPYEETALSPADIINMLGSERVSSGGVVISTPTSLNKEVDALEKTF